MIHTKLHVIHQMVAGDGFDVVVDSSHGANRDEAVMVIEAMQLAPKYCIDPRVVQLLNREEINKSILAILHADIARLPFSPMLIEFSSLPAEGAPHHDPSRYFVLLAEIAERHDIGARVARLSADGEELVVQATPVSIGLTQEGFAIERPPSNDQMGDTMTVAAAVGVALALLMLNTKGIEKEVIHTDRINKARAKHPDRVPVPHHTVVRIGTIYDRSGKAHSATGTGRHMPVHLRAGHTRHQHYGKGNEEVKIVYIPPCIVNFQDSHGEKPRLPDKTIIL